MRNFFFVLKSLCGGKSANTPPTRFSHASHGIIPAFLKPLALVLMFLVVGVGQVWGVEYTLSAASTPTNATTDGFTFSFGKNSGSNDPTWSDPYVKVYYDCYFTISHPTATITKIVYTIKQVQGGKNSNKAYPTGFTMDTGEASFSGTQGQEQSLTWTGSANSVKLTVNGSKGNYSIKKVDITYSSGCTGTKLGTPVVTATPSNGQVVLTWPNVANASGYQLKWNGGEWTSATSGVTKAGLTNGTAYTYQVKAIGNGSTYCDGDASEEADATPNVYYTVTWMNNGSEYTTTSVVSGQKPTFPDSPTSCDAGDGASTTFYGWTTSTWSGKIDDISAKTIYTKASDMPTVTGTGIVYHAVFCKGSDIEVLNEEFDNSSSDDATSVFNTSTFSNFSGTVTYAYKSKYGGVKLGKSSNGGSITSKSLDLSAAFTVSLDACKYSTQSTDITVKVGSTTKTISSSEINTEGAYKTHVISFDPATSSSTVTIATSSERAYIDNVVITRIGTRSKYITTCCTSLGTINGSVNWSQPTEAVVSWDNIANVSSWTLKYKEHGAGSWTTAFTDKTDSDSEITVYSDGGTNNKMKSTIATTCNTAYDFLIIANPASGYCDKEETLENKNSGQWSVAYSLTGVTQSSGPATGANVCGDYSAQFAVSGPAYALPDAITVKVGDETLDPSNYTWNSSTGALSIASAKITGNLSITVTGVEVGCSADPTIGAASLNGTFSNTSVGVTVATSSTGNQYCAWTDYGFVWGTSENPTVEGNKVVVGTSDAATTWNGSLTGSFETGVTYYFRAYGKNSKDDGEYVYGAGGSFTPRSVTFNSNGGSDVATAYVNSGSAVSQPSDPTRTGYDFSGWQLSGANYSFLSDVNTNITLDAVWSAKNYTVTISKNYGSAATKDYEATYDADMPDMSDFNSFTRAGYTLLGIFANADGTGTKYYNEDKSSANVWDQAEDKTIYAAWSPKNYTITLNPEGADEGHEGTESIAVTYDSNDNLTSAITKPERTGYKFSGYFTEADGAGTQLIDEDGNVIVSVSNYTSATKQWTKASDVELHAYWKASYTVTWSVNGTETTEQVVSGEKVAAMSTAPKSSDCDDAKVFVGWRASAIEGTSATNPGSIFTDVDGSPEVTDDVTFYAVFADENGGDFTRVTNTNQLEAGKKVLLGYEAVANSGEIVPIQSTTYNSSKSLLNTGTSTSASGSKTIDMSTLAIGEETNYAFTLRAGHNEGYWAFEMSGDYAGKYLGHKGKNMIDHLDAIGDDDKADFSISIGTNDVASIINKYGNENTTYADSKYINYMVLSYNYNNGNPRVAIYKEAQTGELVMYICNPLVYSNYVTRCASCDEAATFSNAAPTMSGIDCTAATVTATGGLATWGSEGCNISDYGFVLGTSENPTTEDTKLQVGTANPVIGSDFSYDITDLTKGTQYYVRAYATNKFGTAYSNNVSFYTSGVSSIAITTAPAKTNYIVGETFDATGMVVTATMVSGNEVEVTEDVTYSTAALTAGTNADFAINYSLCGENVTAQQKINVYTLTVTEGTNADKGEASYTSGATFSVGILAEHTTVGFDVTNGSVTPNGDGTYTVTPNGSGDVTVTVNYVTAVQVAVKYYINGVEQAELQQNPYQSEEFTLKTASDISSASLAGYPNFVGWSTTPFGYQTSEPTLAPTATQVMEPTNYYAVFTNLDSVHLTVDWTGVTNSYPSAEMTKSNKGISFKYHYICKQSGMQFQKHSSNYGYFYNNSAIANIIKVEIGNISGSNSEVPVYACSASNIISGSALEDENTATDRYIYLFPENTQYFKIKGDNSNTYKISYIDIYYAPEAVYYATEFKTLTFNKADGAVDKTEKVATGKTRTLNADDAPAAVAGYTFIEKWSDGANDYVAGDGVTVNEDMTLNPYSGLITDTDVDINALPATVTEIVVTEGKILTVNNNKTLDNLTIEAGGKVAGSNQLIVLNNLTIESEAGKSGQVMDATKVNAANIYMDVKFYKSAATLDATTANQWYMISAPFDVNLNGGFLQTDGTPMVFGTDFDLFEYDGAKRANTGVTGWKRVSGQMKAGTACLIGFNEGQATTIRLKAANTAIGKTTSITLNAYDGDADNQNWNGVANPNLHYISLDKDVQYYDNVARGYNPGSKSGTSYVVGTAFFIQESGEAIISNTVNTTLQAPRRAAQSQELEFCVRLAKEDANWANHIYIRASEDASAQYEQGHDMVTWNGTTAKTALLWTENYGTRLAIEEAPLLNNQASYALGLYVPANGTYRIEVANTQTDATLYLTQGGTIIWNLMDGAYEVDLTAGTTSEYGLLLQAGAPRIPTGVEEVGASKAAQKVVIDDHVYILRGEKMYDTTGKTVK